ncbi:transposase domain-containing protein [Pseudomonas sp. NPDC098747]
METCKAHGVDAYRYLIDSLKALPLATTVEDYEALLPWSFSTAE